MTRSNATVAEYMTPMPHTVGMEQTLDHADALMKKFHVRHLPVLEGGQLVGVITQRDIALVSALKSVDPSKLPVEDAMTPEPYQVQKTTPLYEVVHHMAEHKYGSAFVVEHGKIVGLLTTTDIARILAQILKG